MAPKVNGLFEAKVSNAFARALVRADPKIQTGERIINSEEQWFLYYLFLSGVDFGLEQGKVVLSS
jgi:hypothetical protein